MAKVPLTVTREQVLAYRRRVNALDARLPRRWSSFRRAAWAGVQDSMPRAALLSIHARIERTEATALDDPALVQIWGPRFSVYVVAVDDLAVFTLGRLPDDPAARHTATELASRLDALLDGAAMPFGAAGRALGEHPNRLRYAAATGSVVLRWDGARQPTVTTVTPPDVDPTDARDELARRYLHVFGPSTAESFGGWAGIRAPSAMAAFERLRSSLTRVTTPIGAAWMLDRDEGAIRTATGADATVRLLPSGDSYYLLHGDDRELLVPNADRRALLWTSRVWPGAILADGEIVGTWRRAKHTVTLSPWGSLAPSVRDRIAAEAAALPVPENQGRMVIVWAEETGTRSPTTRPRPVRSGPASR